MLTAGDHLSGRAAQVVTVLRANDFLRVRQRGALMYLATRPEGVYALHCFQKKTRKTSQRDLDLALRRFRAILKSGGAK